jgi:CubicO group peptidase (beta-lactamase class C family)
MKRLKKTVLFLICFFFFLGLFYADEKTAKVDGLFAEWDKQDSPGCALAVVKDGQIIYKRGYGMANLELGVPITPRSVFYIGSVSKQFTAFCISLLAKEGKLTLDDDIRKHIPEMPDYGNPITIRHLIHHTSGIRDFLELEDIASIDPGSYHEQNVLELLARQKGLNFPPGEEYLYSNGGYFLLGVIVKRASGGSLREFAEEKIFKPLGMKSSQFHDDYRRLIKDRASGYFPTGKDRYQNFLTTFDCVGSGGLFSSVEDLFLWDQNFSNGRVGGKDLIDLMHTQGRLNNGQQLDYAFALTIGRYKGLKTVSHGGALGGYRSMLLRFPDQKFSVIILSNLSSFNTTKLARQVADIYLAEFIQEKVQAEPSDQKKAFPIAVDKLKEKAGAYINRKSGEVARIFFSDDRLTIAAFGSKFPLFAMSETEFRPVEAPAEVKIRFEKQAEGKPLLMRLTIEGRNPETYEAFHPVEPTQEKLKEYAGDYYSDELEVVFRLAIREGKLCFAHRNAPAGALQPTLEDKFVLGNWNLSFNRDGERKIAFFTLDAGRVRNLLFAKKEKIAYP